MLVAASGLSCKCKATPGGTVEAELLLLVFLNTGKSLADMPGRGDTYAGMIPTEISSKDCIRKIDLIFRKDE